MPKTRRKKKPATGRTKRKTAKRRRSERPESSDTEDLLVDMIINSKEKSVNGTDVENLIYNTTSGLGALGYGFGFSVGRAMTLKLGADAPLTAILDRIGLHDSFYYPLRDKAIITSRPSQHHGGLQMGKNIHLYESGVISGYLSTSTGMRVSAEEKRCVYNGSRECQFVATPLSPKPEFSGIGIDEVAYAISTTLREGRYTRSNSEYYRTLAYLPLTDSRISEQILRVMMIAGERLGEESGKGSLRQTVSNLANYFGVKQAKIDRKGRKTIIKLRYESYNSIQAFVAIPTAIIVGFAKSTGRSALARFAANRDGTYTARIDIENKKA
jgi:hypothetical protein